MAFARQLEKQVSAEPYIPRVEVPHHQSRAAAWGLRTTLPSEGWKIYPDNGARILRGLLEQRDSEHVDFERWSQHDHILRLLSAEFTQLGEECKTLSAGNRFLITREAGAYVYQAMLARKRYETLCPDDSLETIFKDIGLEQNWAEANEILSSTSSKENLIEEIQRYVTESVKGIIATHAFRARTNGIQHFSVVAGHRFECAFADSIIARVPLDFNDASDFLRILAEGVGGLARSSGFKGSWGELRFDERKNEAYVAVDMHINTFGLDSLNAAENIDDPDFP